MSTASHNLATRLVEWVAALQRHARFAGITAVVVFAAGTTYVMRMPDVYRAETRILVNPQRVSDKYVTSTVSMGSNERLNTLSQQVMSSTRLEAILDDLHLYPELRRTLGREQVIDVMRRHIAIDLKQSSAGPSSFTITYTGDSAVEVASVTNRLAASFIAANLHDREQEAQGTTAFLSKELADSKSQLDALEEQLRVYKLQHVGELPDQMEANLQALSRLQVQLQANTDAQSRLDHEAFIAKAEPSLTMEARGAPPVPSQNQQLIARDVQAHRELAELRERYKPDFPDVRSKDEQVRTLDRQVAAIAPGDASPAEVPSTPAARGVDPRLQLIGRDRERLVAAQREIEAAVGTYQARVNAEPIREQEISQVLRDYDTAKDHYRSLLEKTYSAQMATELEQRQEGGSFTLLDTARVPDAPVGPNRLAFIFGALVFSLAAGGGVVMLQEMRDGTVKSEAHLHEVLPGVRLLGLTPRLAQSKSNILLTWAGVWSKT